MDTERYFLRPIDESSQTPILELVDDAFNNEGSLEVAGRHEGVAINLGLTVTRLTKTRLRGRTALRFSGIATPGENTYTADVTDAKDLDALIQVEIRPKK